MEAGQTEGFVTEEIEWCKELGGKVAAMDDLKQWVMAVGSSKVECVDQLVCMNLARKGGF